MEDHQYTDEAESPIEPHHSARDASSPARMMAPGKKDAASLCTAKPNRRTLSLCNIAFACSLIFFLFSGIFFFMLTRRFSRPSPARDPLVNQAHDNPNRAKQKHAVAHRLNFPALYPDITSTPGSECRAAWDTLVSVPCDDKLFDRSTDNGTFRPLGWDPVYSLPKICQAQCQVALEEAYDELSAKCSTDDAFILDRYHGMFNPLYLEAGPTAAVQMLLRRAQHLCRSSPDGDSDYEYCPAELHGRFAIVDGINANHNLFKGVARFVAETDKKRTERAHRSSGTRGSGTYSYQYNFGLRQQTYGPGVGETSCGWCIFDFLNRTLNSWTPGGTVTNPDSGEQVSLPEFIRRVRKAGERCSPTRRWDRIYEEAIGRYHAAGLLPTDWEATLPSGDLAYLILNGPSIGDSPVAEIHAELQRFSSPDFLENWEDASSNLETLAKSKACLSALEEHYTSAKCFINLSRDELSHLLEEDQKSLRWAFCSDTCTQSLNSWSAPSCTSPHLTPPARKLMSQYLRAKEQRDTYCGAVGKQSWEWDCGAALLNNHKAQWALDGRPDTATFLAEIDRAVDELEAERPVPELLREALASDRHRLPYDASSSREARDAERQWLKDLGAGVCAGCIWNWLAGPTLREAMDHMREAESVSGYIDVVRKYHAHCTSRGATWMGGTPYGDDPVVWRVKDELGRVMRYIKARETGFERGRVYGLDEARGGVYIYESDRGKVPGVDVGSLWHVLQAGRALEAEADGGYTRWWSEEERHRQQADGEIWEVKWGSVRYIGPKGGIGEKAA